jgi:hypothetical protein
MLGELWRSLWGTITRPRATLDRLAQQSAIRPAVTLAIFALLVGWLNLLLFVVFGYDWLGTRRELLDPTYVGFFGQLRVGLEDYVPIYHGLISPLLALLGLAVIPGLAHVLSKLWRGQGTYEQMVNTLAYAQVPSILVRSVINDMLLGGVPTNLLTRHPYAFTAAMNGEFGPAVATLWWVYMVGIYIFAVDLWVIVLGTLAIRRVQRIPWWASALITLFVYVLWFYGLAGSVVR